MKQKSALSVLLACFPRRTFVALLALSSVAFSVALLPAPAWGDTAEELQQKIADQNAHIAQLEKEIAEYENQLTVIGTARKTLEGEVARLDLSRKKMGADISLTQNKITETNLHLSELGGSIEDKQKRIEIGKTTVAQSLVTVNKIGDITIVEHLLSSSGLAAAWEEADKLEQLEGALGLEVKDLATTKEALTVDYNATEREQAKLVSLKRDLANQKLVLDQNRTEQATLLSQTKNKESEYQKLLATKQQAKLDFERQLNDYEAALKYTFDPTSIPKSGSGVLSFPIDPSFMIHCKDRYNVFKNLYCITQYFGNTAFAQSGAYNGQGHNGVDFGVPEGTRIISALTGTVQETGNTDIYPGCYSYGKWVLVKHSNGLSTLYAHLSVISVARGDSLATGSLIGYSGKTGYATGPHLHFTVYASNGVKIVRLGDVKAKTNCANAAVPVAPTEAYLNPMQYL